MSLEYQSRRVVSGMEPPIAASLVCSGIAIALVLSLWARVWVERFRPEYRFLVPDWPAYLGCAGFVLIPILSVAGFLLGALQIDRRRGAWRATALGFIALACALSLLCYVLYEWSTIVC